MTVWGKYLGSKFLLSARSHFDFISLFFFFGGQEDGEMEYGEIYMYHIPTECMAINQIPYHRHTYNVRIEVKERGGKGEKKPPPHNPAPVHRVHRWVGGTRDS